MTPGENICIGCSCTELRACAGGCSWSVIHLGSRRGVCSQCFERENGEDLVSKLVAETYPEPLDWAEGVVFG